MTMSFTSPEALAEPPVHRFTHGGRVGELLPIVLTNTVLKLLTLGIYQFWATAIVRRYLWGRTSFDGDPLEWTGTGAELFKGLLAVVFLILLPLGVINGAAQYLVHHGRPILGGGIGIAVTVTYASLLPIGIYRARRYRLSRTNWRGIRGTQEGAAWKYALLWWKWGIIVPFSLFLTVPLRDIALQRYKLAHTVFGDRPVQCTAKAGDLYPRFLVCWLLAAVAVVLLVVVAMPQVAGTVRTPRHVAAFGLLIVLFFVGIPLLFSAYQAELIRQLAAATTWSQLSFRVSITAWQLVRLTIPNFFIIALSLGLALPFAQLRKARLAARCVAVLGDQDFAAVAQNQAQRPSIGEGLVTIFDGVDI
jgi:uncharacterized membrane protein YjgN (DUF898 family)